MDIETAPNRVQANSVARQLVQSWTTSPDALVQSSVGVFSEYYAKADDAWRNDRRLAAMMDHDADLIRAIDHRTLSIAGQDWNITYDDKGNAELAARAAVVEKVIRQIPDLSQLLKHLASHWWFGSSACQFRYMRLPRPTTARVLMDNRGQPADSPGEGIIQVESSASVVPVSWTPIIGESVLFSRSDPSQVGLLGNYYGRRGDGFSYGTDGPVIVLTPEQRLTMVVATWGRTGPRYVEPYSAEHAFGGRGMRALLWYAWLIKQTFYQLMAYYAERFSKGQLMVFTGTGQNAEAVARSIIDAMFTGQGIVVPRDTANPDAEVVKFFEPSGTGFDQLREAWQSMRTQIVHAILHQSLTTEAGSTGLGSGLASEHRTTFNLVIEMDSRILADSLTRDLVSVIYKANFPGEEACPLSWRFGANEAEMRPDEVVDRALKLAQMGVPIAVEDLRRAAGFRTPREGEPVIGATPSADPLQELRDRILGGEV